MYAQVVEPQGTQRMSALEVTAHSDLNEGSGFRPFKDLADSICARKYVRQLEPLVEIAVESGIENRLSHSSSDRPALFAGLIFDFRDHRIQQMVSIRGRTLEAQIDAVVQNAAAAVRETVSIQQMRTEGTMSRMRDLHDIVEEQTSDLSSIELPQIPDSLKDDLQSEYLARRSSSKIQHMRFRAGLGWAAALALTCLEIALVVLTFEPILGGTSSSASLLVTLQALAAALVLVSVAHKAIAGTGVLQRLLAGVGLLVLSLALSALRILLLGAPEGSDYSSIPPEILLIGAISLVTAIGIAASSATAVQFAIRMARDGEAYHDENGEEIAEATARIQTRDSTRQHADSVRALRRRVQQIVSTEVPAEISRAEIQMRGEQSVARQIVRAEVLSARRKLDEELRSTAHQLARWRREESLK